MDDLDSPRNQPANPLALKKRLQELLRDRDFIAAMEKIGSVHGDNGIDIRREPDGTLMLFTSEKLPGSNIPHGDSISLQYYLDETIRGEDGANRYEEVRTRTERMAKSGVSVETIDRMILQAKQSAYFQGLKIGEADVRKIMEG